jgi:hypothetical protein
LQKTLRLIARFVQIILEILDGLVSALYLALEILDSAIDAANATSFGRACLLEVLELRFQLRND